MLFVLSEKTIAGGKFSRNSPNTFAEMPGAVPGKRHQVIARWSPPAKSNLAAFEGDMGLKETLVVKVVGRANRKPQVGKRVLAKECASS